SETAISAYETVIELAPDNVAAVVNLSHLLASTGRLSEAESVLQASCEQAVADVRVLTALLCSISK
ncbi:MAG: tetratricopeptide repeat protein, partial [Proteobacteria bacterium]|nr:tetratricopeptide repeat protein [Pseudomonadota bacterium]